MSKDAAPRMVSCPTCGKQVPWTPESHFRPFCSERCKNVDLGAWASEGYRIEQQQAGTDSDQGD